MNILHVAPSYYPAYYWGGPIFSVYGLNNALSRLPGVTLKVLTTDSAGPRIEDRVDLDRLDAKNYPNQDIIFTRRVAGACISIELLYKLPRLIRWANIVHLTATYSFPTIPTIALCRLYRKPLVWSPRGAILEAYEWDAPHKRIKHFWEYGCNAMILPNRVIMHTTSDREREAGGVRVKNASSVIVPNGVDVISELPQKIWLPDGSLRLMYIGRLSQKKGIENLLYALKVLNDPSISLVLYGTGDSTYVNSLHALSRELGLLDRASFMGEVTGEAKSAAFHKADVCVVPSHTENFCNVVTEAMAHGVPVIASQGTPWRRLISMRCGWWVENSPHKLAEAIVEARTQPLEEMGLRGWKWVAAEYSWDAVARQMMAAYHSLLSI